jgi:hypothetical protein
MSFETMNGTTIGGELGWPQPGALLISGALAQTAPAEDADGLPLGVGWPDELHATTIRASAHNNGARRRGLIADRVSPSVGTCRRGRMTAS